MEQLHVRLCGSHLVRNRYIKFAVAGGIVTEGLLKGRDGGKLKFNFMDMQTWLYFYGVLLNFGIFCLTNHDYTLEDFKQNMFGKKMETHVQTALG